MKPQTESRISQLADELEKGAERRELIGKYGKKWDLTAKGMDRILKLARPLAEQRLRERQALSDKVREAEITDAARTQTVSLIEVDSILSQILNGTYTTEEVVPGKDGVFKSVKRKPSQQTILRALDLYYKRFGHYPPVINKNIITPDESIEEFTMTYKTINSKDDLTNDAPGGPQKD